MYTHHTSARQGDSCSHSVEEETRITGINLSTGMAGTRTLESGSGALTNNHHRSKTLLRRRGDTQQQAWAASVGAEQPDSGVGLLWTEAMALSQPLSPSDHVEHRELRQSEESPK